LPNQLIYPWRTFLICPSSDFEARVTQTAKLTSCHISQLASTGGVDIEE
jgi:hypothetical protein